jgi:hypothetical protein
MNYAGSSNGTSGDDEAALQSILEGLLTAANPAQPNNSRGLVYADQGGNDTVTGTNFNDFFWLSTGNDSINGGAGAQDRAAFYWTPSSTAGNITTDDKTTPNTIKVQQQLPNNGAKTDLVWFTKNTDNSWTVTTQSDTLIYSYSGSGTKVGTDTLTGIEQVLLVLPSTALDSNGNPLVTLTGLTNNAFVVDLTLS